MAPLDGDELWALFGHLEREVVAVHRSQEHKGCAYADVENILVEHFGSIVARSKQVRNEGEVPFNNKEGVYKSVGDQLVEASKVVARDAAVEPVARN